MNVHTINYGKYRVSSYGHGHYSLMNTETEKTHDLTTQQWRNILNVGGEDVCMKVEKEVLASE